VSTLCEKNQLKIRKSKKDITILITIETRTPVSHKGSYMSVFFTPTHTTSKFNQL
jgi:hypothetical protein